MKTFTILALIALSFQIYRQQTLEVTSDKNECSYIANDAQYDTNKKVFNLRGQVTIKCEGFRILNATHVIYDPENKLITAKGFDEYRFIGTTDIESLKDTDSEEAVLNYTIGADVLYITLDEQR